jgi:hypothetical protein
MKRIAMFASLLLLASVLGCEGKKPEKIQTNAPPAEPSAADMTPGDTGAPADAAPTGDKPAEEPAK